MRFKKRLNVNVKECFNSGLLIRDGFYLACIKMLVFFIASFI